ncbi:transglutaminase domain-containing protein [Candidatus Woesearchaeota archaeon]|nr:transglutaminase domain-containing protein [Candidatus Woesearchaeota archaeon]
MMKKLFLFLFVFTLALSFVNAEPVDNYNEFQYVEMALSLSSYVDLEHTSGSHSVEYVRSELSFFPRDGDRQDVKDLEAFSSPSSTIQQGTESITYTWSGDEALRLSYSYDAVVRVENSLTRIDQKIKFPLAKLDSIVLEYTQPTEFIDINSKIEKKAKEIIGTEDDLYEAVFKIADWTNKNIEYNLSTLTAEAVLPSSWVLENRQGVCDEMTNLFISLLRSVGIPARFVSGMVYSNTDYSWGPHGWTEVYFPEIGWVPFDVTFGEYGWVDPSHLKLKDNIDSGSPTAKYSWKSTGTDLNVGALEINTEELKVGPVKSGAVEVEVIPMFPTAKFGSYVPVEIRVRNIKNSYIIPKIVVSKAPGLTEKNVKSIFLKPKEEKSIYWIAEISNDDPGYIYTTTLEAKSMYGEVGSSIIKYGGDFEFHSKESALAFVEGQEERDEKEELDNIDISCSTGKDLYYSGETATIECEVKSNHNSPMDVDICFQQECTKFDIGAGDKIVASETFDLTEGIRIPVVLESMDKIKYEYVNINVIPIPEITISNPDPAEVNYHDQAEISFDISSNTDVTDLNIKFDFGEMSYDNFKAKEVRTITINTLGRDLMSDIKFEMSYKDELGMDYREQKALHIIVKDIPWYGPFVNWMRNIF